MSGSHRPGLLYKITVTAIDGNVVSYTGDVTGSVVVSDDDLSYFVVGNTYVSIFTPYCEYSVGKDSPEPQPGR